MNIDQKKTIDFDVKNPAGPVGRLGARTAVIADHGAEACLSGHCDPCASLTQTMRCGRRAKGLRHFLWQGIGPPFDSVQLPRN